MAEIDAPLARRAIVEHTRRLAAAAGAAGPDAPVPTTPGWTVADLVAHVGQTQHWVADIVERRVADPTQLSMEMAPVPADPGEWPAWLDGSAQRVADACSDDALDAPVWNAAGDGRSGTRFWLASMVNESVVHGFDGAVAAGRPVEVEPSVAAALIGNHLAMLTSPTWAAQRPESAGAIRGSGETLLWRATDVTGDEGAWLVERGPDGATWRLGAAPADVTVGGPAGALLQVLTRRLPLDEAGPAIAVDGDAALARHWLASTAHVAD